MPAIWIPKRLVEYSLINVASENTERFVQRCETQYENRIFQAAGAVLESGRKIVMLTGPSASGRTRMFIPVCLMAVRIMKTSWRWICPASKSA